jgi:hypothetical protein
MIPGGCITHHTASPPSDAQGLLSVFMLLLCNPTLVLPVPCAPPCVLLAPVPPPSTHSPTHPPTRLPPPSGGAGGGGHARPGAPQCHPDGAGL